MRKVYKYVINKRTKSIEIPVGFKILSAQEQHDDISIWTEVDPDAELMPVYFMLIRTDEEIPDRFIYISSIQADRPYSFLYHVYYKAE